MKATSHQGASSQCRTCGRRWPESYTQCPDDGGELISSAGSFTEVVATDPTDQVLVNTTADDAYAHTVPNGDSNDLAPGTIVGEYCVETKIGDGGMGAVYAAKHPTIGKRVAIKIMAPRLSRDPAAVERFVGEARAVAAIRHPGIVDVFGFGELADGRLYLVMELLYGESLGGCLEHKRLTLADALDLLFQMTRALEAAHDEGIIHRDLKPENVFLVRVAKEPKPIVKLLDFGLAKLVDNADRSVRRTQSGQLLGTPLYMSPEQCRAKLVDHRTDIYALGCIAYELFCGRVPFDFDNVAELFAAHLTEEAPRPCVLWPQIPPALDTLLLAMLAKDAASRPTLDHIQRTISTLRDTMTSQALVPATVRAGSPRPGVAQTTLGGTTTGEIHVVRASASRTRRVIAGIGASLAIAALAIVINKTRQDAEDRPDPVEAASALPPQPKMAPPVRPESGSGEPAVTSPPAADHVVTAVEKSPKRGKPMPAKAVASSAGALALSSTPACDISIDGKPTGLRTPQRKIKLDVGTHSITLTSTGFAIRDTFSIEIKPGELATQTKVYPTRTVDPAPDGTTTLNPFKKPAVSP